MTKSNAVVRRRITPPCAAAIEGMSVLNIVSHHLVAVLFLPTNTSVTTTLALCYVRVHFQKEHLFGIWESIDLWTSALCEDVNLEQVIEGCSKRCNYISLIRQQ